MNDDGTNIIVSQQRRDLVIGNWASATIFVPRRVSIGDKLLHHLLRCYFRAVLGEHRPQSRQQLYSDAWLIWGAREVNRRPTCLLGPTTTSMLRNLQQQFPIGTRPIVKAWRLRRLQVLDDTDVVGSPPCESLRPIVENSGSSAYAKSSAFSLGFFFTFLYFDLLSCGRCRVLAQDAKNFRARRSVPTPLPAEEI